MGKFGKLGFAFYDTGCVTEYCFYCKIDDFQHFRIKGLCHMEEHHIDQKYVFRPKSLIDGRPIWKGYSSSLISWNKDLQRWVLSNRITKEVLASIKSETPFAIGDNIWQLESKDICIYDPNISGVRSLNTPVLMDPLFR